MTAGSDQRTPLVAPPRNGQSVVHHGNPATELKESYSMTSSEKATLYTLGDRGQTVDGSSNDIRGRQVQDNEGVIIGKVEDLLIDDLEHKVRFLLVEHGGFLGFGQKKTMIPVDVVTKITESTVMIDQSSGRLAAAPVYDPKLVNDRVYHASLYNYYGYAPYWGAGYMYPMGVGMGMGGY
jgi:sporulation protein YlmC with PRC-barrel domain